MPERLIFAVVLLIVVLHSAQSLSQQTDQQSNNSQAPAKIALSPVRVENRLGDEVPLQINLLDRNGRPAAANQNIAADVKVEQPSGQTATYSVTFAPGESSKELPVPIPESGVSKVTVEQTNKQLIGGSNFVLVRPAGKKRNAKVPKSAKEPKTEQKGPGSELRDVSRGGTRVHLLRVALRVSQPSAALNSAQAVAVTPPAPQLQLEVSGEDANGGTRADGKTCASVQVFYLGEADLQRDVQIWLSFSNGRIDNNPIVIQKGTAVGTACWVSSFPIQAATIRVAATNPPGFTFASLGDGGDPKVATHKFTDNIAGIQFVNAPQSITIVNSFLLTAQFIDPNNEPVRLTQSRDVHFTTDNAALGINPGQITVPIGAFDASTQLTPTYFGISTVRVSTPYYDPVPMPIRITWIGVLCLSLLGGFLGGLLAWMNSNGKLVVRIITGLIVGLVASWAYVIVGLPKLETSFLHNQLSVFFVALLVGLSGVKGATFISSKLKLPSF